MFNARDFEIDSGLIDIADSGVLSWDAEVDYVPADDAVCFVTTASGLWLTRMSTGPSFGNVTDPQTAGQTVWRRF